MWVEYLRTILRLPVKPKPQKQVLCLTSWCEIYHILWLWGINLIKKMCKVLSIGPRLEA